MSNFFLTAFCLNLTQFHKSELEKVNFVAFASSIESIDYVGDSLAQSAVKTQ